MPGPHLAPITKFLRRDMRTIQQVIDEIDRKANEMADKIRSEGSLYGSRWSVVSALDSLKTWILSEPEKKEGPCGICGKMGPIFERCKDCNKETWENVGIECEVIEPDKKCEHNWKLTTTFYCNLCGEFEK